jgi:sugar phosphate isomerase/epimerase
LNGEAIFQLSGFGDEIDAVPAIQMAVLQALGASHIEVRSAWNTNVVDFDDDQRGRFGEMLVRSGMAVSAIASPVGKVDVADPVEAELSRLGAAIRAAHAYGARYIRIFSFYHRGRDAGQVRGQVIDHLGRLAERAAAEDIVLLHENEKEIYGDVPARVLDLVESVGSPALRLAFDNANFVQCGVRPYTDGWALLAPYVDYLQVKDAVKADGSVVPAGAGDGELRETLAALRDRGYRGYASLEPHLATADASGGFSGPYAFGVAARALRTLTDRLGVRLA